MTFEIAALRDSVSEGAAVLDGFPDRLLYSRDCWMELQIQTRAGRHALHPPDAIVVAAEESDVVAVVRFCAETGTPLVPYGAGSGVAGAAVPTRGGIMLDL